MANPNFFLVGAPKCGTTSMASWLRDHDNVFVPELKEPEYFNGDHKRRRRVSDRQYKRIFEPANPEIHLAIGEASVWYLYSKVAITRILEAYGNDVKFVVMLRNPLEMAISLYRHKCYVNFEHIENFEEAWDAQDDRRAGRRITTDADASQLVYGEACKVGEQLERLVNTAGRSNVLPILLEDVAKDPGASYRKILAFLNVPDDGRTDFRRLNGAKTYKNKLFHDAIQGAAKVKLKLGINYNFNLLRFNRKPAPRLVLSPHLREQLKDYFRKDVHLLSEILSRDVTDWVSDETAAATRNQSNDSLFQRN